METEKQKFYKHKIKRIIIANKDNTSAVIVKSDTIKPTVTILGSTSYHKQVNDLSIINSNNIDQQRETLIDDRNYLNYESHFYGNTVDETKTTDENIPDLKNRDVIINEETIEVEIEYQSEIVKPEVTEIERTISNDSLQPTITDIIPEKDMDILRKSLEEDNIDDNVQLMQIADEHPMRKKNKRVGLKKSFVDF